MFIDRIPRAVLLTLVATCSICCCNKASEPAAVAPATYTAEPARSTQAPVVSEATRTGTVQTTAAAAGANAGRLIIPTGEMSTSVLMVEKSLPPEIVLAKPYEYQIKATNISKNKLEGVVVTDTLPSNLKLAQNSDITVKEGLTTINVGALNPGESRTYLMSATATGGTSVRSCLAATYNTTLCLSTPIVAPAIKLVISAPSDVMVCDTIPVKLIVTNTGTGPARGIKIENALPAGMTVDGKNAASFDVGTLNAGQSKELSFNARVAKSGKYDNKATARAEGDMTTESSLVSTVARQPVLGIAVKCPPEKLRSGQAATYEITVSNKGDGNAADTVLQMPIIRGLDFASATEGGAVSGANVAWRLGEIAPGKTKTVAMTGKAGAAGILKSTFSAAAKCADPVSDTCTVEVVGAPDIGAGFTDDDGVVTVGTNHEFRYAMKNQGQVDLTNVKVEFTPDAGLEFVSTDAAGGAAAAAGKHVVNLGTVKVGETKGFKIVFKGTKEGELIIQSVTTSDQTRAVRNDEQVNYVK